MNIINLANKSTFNIDYILHLIILNVKNLKIKIIHRHISLRLTILGVFAEIDLSVTLECAKTVF